MAARHKAFDFNKNGEVTLKEFLKAMDYKKNFYFNHYPQKIPKELEEVWTVNYERFRDLPESAKDSAIAYYENLNSSPENITEGIKKRLEDFDAADANKDGHLDLEEWKSYYKKYEEDFKNAHGAEFHFTDEELEKSFKAHDFDNSGGITKDEFLWARRLQK